MSATKMIMFGYLILILFGAVLLLLPFATRGGGTSLETALFTATSATCVTGLIMEDTYTYWSLFGQLVILILVQIGGIGFMTIAITAISFTKLKIGLHSRFVMQQSVSAPQVGGIVRMTKFIILGSLLFEGIGAVLLAFRFCPLVGFADGLYFAVWHSITSFCNAGFDLMGAAKPFSSLTTVDVDIMLNVVIMLLITIGGLGFFVWSDIAEHKLKIKAYKLSTKLVLITSLLLTVGGAAMIFLYEHNEPSMEGRTVGERLLLSLFQSVSCRTAGYNTMNLGVLSEAGKMAMSFLMFIGGSPASTAGGLKTTTLAVLFLSITIVFKQKKSIEVFGRRIEDSTLQHACCLLVLYLTLTLTVSTIISEVEGLPFIDCLFESVSAVGTVGMTVGITGSLSVFSHLLLILLMFIGRIGGLTLLLALGKPSVSTGSKLPVEKIVIG